MVHATVGVILVGDWAAKLRLGLCLATVMAIVERGRSESSSAVGMMRHAAVAILSVGCEWRRVAAMGICSIYREADHPDPSVCGYQQ